jgi:hypothetical protein
MRGNSEIRIEGEDDPVVLNKGSAESTEEDRLLGAVMHEIARSLAGWLFFVVAVQLLLHGSHLF